MIESTWSKAFARVSSVPDPYLIPNPPQAKTQVTHLPGLPGRCLFSGFIHRFRPDSDIHTHAPLLNFYGTGGHIIATDRKSIITFGT